MHKVRIKTKRQLDALHSAGDAVLGLRARRARELVNEDEVRPPTPEEIERFSVGGCDNGCGQPDPCRPTPAPCGPTPLPCPPSSINRCYHEVAEKHRCALEVASGGQVGVLGESRIAFSVEPAQSNYFLPIAVRLSARSRDDPGLLMVWRLTAVMVKSHPQESYHEPTPTALTVVGVESAAYDGVGSGKVPGFEVAWGPFSRVALANHLELVGWNPFGPDTGMDPRAEIWGFPIDGLPTGWKCGQHPGLTPMPGGGHEPRPPSSSLPTG